MNARVWKLAASSGAGLSLTPSMRPAPVSVVTAASPAAVATPRRSLITAYLPRNVARMPMARGRTIAIIPVHNAVDERVRELVLAVAAQTVPPDEIHVIDDGSATPVRAFAAPTLSWHWQPHHGSRHALASILHQFEPREWDFVFTLGPEARPDSDVLEALLRSMSNPRMQAATVLSFVHNRLRMIRSGSGGISAKPGAAALYRADPVYDELGEFLAESTGAEVA